MADMDDLRLYVDRLNAEFPEQRQITYEEAATWTAEDWRRIQSEKICARTFNKLLSKD